MRCGIGHCLLHLENIGAGAERDLARAAEQHDLEGCVARELGGDALQSLPHRMRDGVAFIGAIQCHGRKRRGTVEQQIVHGD
jgi:hypothetical protein